MTEKHEQLTGAPSTSGAHEPRRRRVRIFAVSLVTSLLTLGGVSAGAVPAASARSTVTLTDWRDESLSGQGPGWSSPYGGTEQSPWGSSGSTSVGTVDSEAASSSQSTGVVLIDTVLGYSDAAAAGTGIVLTASGQVLTNYHVVQGATSIKVTIASSGRTYTATVVGDDQTDDVALLQLSGASGLKTATIDDDPVSVGDDVTAVGNAGGTGTLTAANGSVTSLNESITTSSEDGTEGETLHDLIATDADVVAGDSGGPLYDDEGEVIGVDTAASSGAEINGYAIAIDDALDIVEQIRSGDETSTVQIGAAPFLGVETTTSSTTDTGYGTGTWGSSRSSSYTGALVAGVVDDTPAAHAGLAAGDVITAVDGSAVESSDDLSTTLAKHDVGDRVDVTCTDSTGTSHSDTVTLAASPVA
jgi:S1-C subfamily serine protease